MAKNKQLKTVSPDDINPVDYFNRNFTQYVFDLLSKKQNISVTGHNSLTYITNSSDAKKRMIVIDDNGLFEATMKNGLEMPVGVKFTPFMMLQKYIFKNNFNTSLSHVVIECMNNSSNYIRVGTTYYQKISKIDRYGIKRTELKVWNRPTIVLDHGKDTANAVEKFYDFTMIPNNVNYEYQINGNYNLYAPFEHSPIGDEKLTDKCQFPWIEKLLKHIWGYDEVSYEKACRYIKILYEYPKQTLPILVLTSTERQTGKSTLVDFFNILFGANTVVINPADISNSFNEPYATKNIIMIEESRFDSVQATEKLKNLATQKKISVNAKFVQQYSLPFFGKIIITSNDEQKFSKVDEEEIRYWVLKIPTLKGKENHNILEDMTKEIPYFLQFLKDKETPDFTKSRQVFTNEEIRTDALLRVKRESRPELQKEIEFLLENHCMNNRDIKTLFFTAMDIKNKFFEKNGNITIAYINKILKNHMSLEKSEKATRYIPIETFTISYNEKIVGKPYEFRNAFYNIDLEETFNDEDHFL